MWAWQLKLVALVMAICFASVFAAEALETLACAAALGADSTRCTFPMGAP